MSELYVLIMYCRGLCPEGLTVPDNLHTYKTLDACEKIMNMTPMNDGPSMLFMPDGRSAVVDLRQACARIIIDE